MSPENHPLLCACRLQVLGDMHQRFGAISSYAPEHAATASTVLQSAEALLSDIRAHHAQVRDLGACVSCIRGEGGGCVTLGEC